MSGFTENELERYSRQFVLPEWSGDAQSKLKAANVLIVGAGALGSPAATYLAAAGVGHIGIIDDDTVELSNLARQPLHFTQDIGRSKSENAALKLGLVNPEVVLDSYPVRLTEQNAHAIVMGMDVVVDCSDTFATRYLVNQACCAQRVPLVEGGVLGFAGQVLTVKPGESACYRCVFATEPAPGSVPSCREAGVLGATAGIIGSIQALEAIKLITGVHTPLLDTILQLDAATMEQTLVSTSRRADCPACGHLTHASHSA